MTAQPARSSRHFTLAPHWATRSHPVYRRELHRWRGKSLWWRFRQFGCVPILLFFALAAGTLSGLAALDPLSQPVDKLLMMTYIPMIALLVGQGIAAGTIGFNATSLASIVISSEIESETFSMLRVTTVPTNEIVLAKYAAVLRHLRVPLMLIIGTRMLLIVAIIPLFDLIARTSGLTGGLLQFLREIPPDLLRPDIVLAITLPGLMWLGYFAIQPFFVVMMHTSVGLFASSITRTRNKSITAGSGLRIVLFMIRVMVLSSGTIGVNLYLARFTQPFWLDELINSQPGTLIIAGGFTAIVALLLNFGWRAVLTYVLVRFSVHRASRLPYE